MPTPIPGGNADALPMDRGALSTQCLWYVNPLASVPLCRSGLVTTMLTLPGLWGGVCALICVALITTTEVAAAPPKVTVAPDAKFIPFSITDVPPLVRPVLGETLVTVGAGAPKVKPLASVALCRSGLVTTTDTLPCVCGGVFAVIRVALITTTEVAAAPPMVTVAPDAKFCPVNVTGVLPVVGPLVGATAVRVGGATNVNPLARVALCPLAFVTTTFTLPCACGGVCAVICVAPTTTTEVAATPPKVTVVPDPKFCPVSVTGVPPVIGPLAGETVVRTGAISP
jgi:hypothetical protein